LREGVRAEARRALDDLLAKAGPLVHAQPKEAHRLLLEAGNDFPPDLAAEITTMLERTVERMFAMTRTRTPPPAPSPGPTPPAEAPPSPGTPAPAPGAGDPPPPAPAPAPAPPPAVGGADAEAGAMSAWRAAYADLQAGRHAEARTAYTLLLQQHAETEAVRHHRKTVNLGLTAAKAGVEGPGALLIVPSETKRGRIEVAYEFDRGEELEGDFTVEQPFSSEMAFDASWKRGAVLMRHATGLFHRLVFDADVRLEATVEVQVPNDFGPIAVEDTDSYRALVLTIANTRFKLKKGADARANPGHVLWYIGQGVWDAADADAHGFIKIAERGSTKLEGGDRLRVELARRSDRAEGGFQGKTDGVHLEGRVVGDDGSTMGPARVGLFTNGTSLVVESLRISGVVNRAWFQKELAMIIRASAPPEDR
jgi:hypothetical protein